MYIILSKYKFAIPNTYQTVRKDDSQYMSIHFMSDECIGSGEDVLMILYRQVDNIAYTEHQIRPNIDITDIPFIDIFIMPVF